VFIDPTSLQGAMEREKTYKPCLDAVEEHFSHIPEEDRSV